MFLFIAFILYRTKKKIATLFLQTFPPKRYLLTTNRKVWILRRYQFFPVLITVPYFFSLARKAFFFWIAVNEEMEFNIRFHGRVNCLFAISRSMPLFVRLRWKYLKSLWYLRLYFCQVTNWYLAFQFSQYNESMKIYFFSFSFLENKNSLQNIRLICIVAIYWCSFNTCF